MTSHTVHPYREMRLVFQDIEAESPEEAADLAAIRAADYSGGVMSALHCRQIWPEGSELPLNCHALHPGHSST